MRPRATTNRSDDGSDIESNITNDNGTPINTSRHLEPSVPLLHLDGHRNKKTNPMNNNNSSKTSPSIKTRFYNMILKFKMNIIGEIKRGLDPHILALSIATGITCGLWPIYFTTTFICGIFDICARILGYPLSTIIVQSINVLMGPLEFILAIPLLHLGEYLFTSSQQTPISPSDLAKLIKNDPWHLQHILCYSILGWLFCFPFVFALIYFLCIRYMGRFTNLVVGEKSSMSLPNS